MRQLYPGGTDPKRQKCIMPHEIGDFDRDLDAKPPYGCIAGGLTPPPTRSGAGEIVVT